jgi:membrane-bound serine protease (ClpP class)
MRKAALILAVVVAGFLLPLYVNAATVVEIRLSDEIIQPISAEYVTEGIKHAEQIDADAVLLWINTPGGLADSMREIVNAITTSKVPVIVYVAPTGSGATSAGFFILLASDIAVMAPGTTTGAASPVLFGGGEPDETMKKKVMSDAAAYLRSYASKRDRNPEVAELAVTEAKSFTDQEALEAGIVDAILESREQILEQFHGQTITRFDGRAETLELADAGFQPWEMTRRQRFLNWLTDPKMLFLFLIFGILGLYVEFNNPGLIFPGVIGGICIVLALFAMHLLPVNYAAVLLIVLAVVFFVLEAMFVSHGVLAAGGVAAIVIGAMMLIESPPIPELRVPLELALAVAVPFAILAVLFLRLVLRSRRWSVATGKEELVGATGEVRQEIGGDSAKGLVLISGELWRATAPARVEVGEVVRVVSVDGLILRVEVVDGSSAASQSAGKE